MDPALVAWLVVVHSDALQSCASVVTAAISSGTVQSASRLNPHEYSPTGSMTNSLVRRKVTT